LILALHPFAALIASVYLIGAYAILAGGVMVVLGFRLRRLHGTTASPT
jgi:uncharacterized membrane protein HdeD (DUF308 family)